MQVFTKLLVCALALAALTADAADSIRKGCDNGGADHSPLPTTANPDQTTPGTVKTPTDPTAVTQAPTPTVTTQAPTPTTTTQAPGVVDPKKEYMSEGSDCQGYLRLPPPGQEISQQDCVLPYKVKFTPTDAKTTVGCVVCEAKWGGKFVYDNSTDLDKQTVPLCAGKPLCTRFGGYGDLTEYDLMCVLRENGASPIVDPKGCGFNDN